MLIFYKKQKATAIKEKPSHKLLQAAVTGVIAGVIAKYLSTKSKYLHVKRKTFAYKLVTSNRY